MEKGLGCALSRAGLSLLVYLFIGGCARQPAQCELPVGDKPPAPRAEQQRRLVASVSSGAGCRVRLQLSDDTRADSWLAQRDAALAAAEVAARACCAEPHAQNVAAWPPGTTRFDVEFGCVAP